MKNFKFLYLITALLLLLTSCKSVPIPMPTVTFVEIQLSDSGITVDGKAAPTDESSAVYIANDIVYYHDGTDFTYGEGTQDDMHTAEEASAHTVVHITKPGNYTLSGKLSKGQIAVDLGEDAKQDPNAVVNLTLNGADITCTVAPAVIFYNVYECGSDDAETATKDVDTSSAGANVFIADNTVNNINGSYVAKIYKPDSVVLSEDSKSVEDAKKLHKYDGAFYSRMSMNIDGNDGILNITAQNEGLDSELHLTLNGGKIKIYSGNDGINTNEDYVSVTTINGGELYIEVKGQTGEGDGIDSNGWLVINGGTVMAFANSDSQDSGIDSDMGIHINGGTVIATGNMSDRIEASSQTHAVFNFETRQGLPAKIALKGADKTLFDRYFPNDFSILLYSSADLKEGTYTLEIDGEVQSAVKSQGGMNGMGGMQKPDDAQRPEMPDGMQIPEGAQRPQMPEGMQIPEGIQPPEMPEGMEYPEGTQRPNKPFNEKPSPEGDNAVPEGDNHFPDTRNPFFQTAEASNDIIITQGENTFFIISPAQ